MQLRYDLSVGALYIHLSDRTIARTAEIDDNTNVDLDADGQAVGIEVISIYHWWPLEDILVKFSVAEPERAQLRAYFEPQAAGFDGAPVPPVPPNFSAEPVAAVLVAA